MGQCLSAPPPPGATRALRCMAVPGGRHFYVWQEWYQENDRLLKKLKDAARALLNMPVKRGFNGWHEGVEAQHEAKRKLMEACRGIINAKAKKAFCAWAETCAEANAKKAKLRAALAGMTPEATQPFSFLLSFLVSSFPPFFFSGLRPRVAPDEDPAADEQGEAPLAAQVRADLPIRCTVARSQDA